MKPFIVTILLPVITLFVYASASAEIEHSGFLGGPFHGVSRDISGAIVNRVGPLADLAETVSLTAGSSRSKIMDGESSQLQAAIRLDDGTITKLLPQDVQWSSESASLLIADGFATATKSLKMPGLQCLPPQMGFRLPFLFASCLASPPKMPWRLETYLCP